MNHAQQSAMQAAIDAGYAHNAFVGADPQPMSLCEAAYHDLEVAQSYQSDRVLRLEQALASVLRDDTVAAIRCGETTKPCAHSPMHGRFITATDRVSEVNRAIDSLLDRLTI